MNIKLAVIICALVYSSFCSAVEMQKKNITLKITEVFPEGRVTLGFENLSKLPISIWKDSNSWGAARWRIVRIRKGDVQVYFQNPSQLFTRNIPSYTLIGSGAYQEQILDVNGGNWCLQDHCSKHNERGINGRIIRFDPSDLILAIYDVPLTNEATKMDVWYGVAVAQRSPITGS